MQKCLFRDEFSRKYFLIRTIGYRANVHGYVNVFSGRAEDRARSFFDGYLQDDVGKKRFFGYSLPKEQKLRQLIEARKPVQLTNVVTQPSRLGDDMEFKIWERTGIFPSTRQYVGISTTLAKTSDPITIQLNQLGQQVPYQRVNFSAGVIDAMPESRSENGVRVRKITVADATATANMSPWNDFIPVVELNRSYFFTRMMVTDFGGTNVICTPKKDGAIQPIPDLTGIKGKQSTANAEPERAIIMSAKIGVISELNCQIVCPSCRRGHLLPIPQTPDFGRCFSCPSIANMKMGEADASASFIVQHDTTSTRLYSSKKFLMAICSSNDVNDITHMNLFQACPFTVQYDVQTMEITDLCRTVPAFASSALPVSLAEADRQSSCKRALFADKEDSDDATHILKPPDDDIDLESTSSENETEH